MIRRFTSLFLALVMCIVLCSCAPPYADPTPGGNDPEPPVDGPGTVPELDKKLLQEFSGNIRSEELGGFFLNLKYEDGKLLCFSAASVNRFPKDRVLEEAWDLRAEQFFRGHGLAVSTV